MSNSPNEDRLSKKFPEHIARIKQLAKANWLVRDPYNRSPADTLAAAFLWNTTDEGHDFWNDIYENAKKARQQL